MQFFNCGDKTGLEKKKLRNSFMLFVQCDTLPLGLYTAVTGTKLQSI